MEVNSAHNSHGNDEEEYVLLDLDDVFGQVDIPPGAPYTLSGLDTLNPILVIGDKVKLIGKYEETIGTCLVFSEDGGNLAVPRERGSEEYIHAGKHVTDPNQAAAKYIRPVAGLQKILKFRLLTGPDDVQEPKTSKSDLQNP